MMSRYRRNAILLVILFFFITISSCNFTSQPIEETVELPDERAAAATTVSIFLEAELTFTGSKSVLRLKGEGRLIWRSFPLTT
jgi:hypothetical protein